jgi:hypothetical protein
MGGSCNRMYKVMEGLPHHCKDIAAAPRVFRYHLFQLDSIGLNFPAYNTIEINIIN